MTAKIPVGPNIHNFEVPGFIAVISPNPNFHIPGIMGPWGRRLIFITVSEDPCIRPNVHDTTIFSLYRNFQG